MPPETVEAPTAPQPQVAEPDPTPILAHPGYDSESYGWPEETKETAPSATPDPKPAPAATQPEAKATPAPAPAEPKPAPEATAPQTVDEKAALAAAIAGDDLTAEQLAAIRKNPAVAKAVDDAANARYGNLKQQEETRRAQQQQEEENWTQSQADYTALTQLKASADPGDQAKAKAYEDDPKIQRWLSWHHAEAAKRATQTSAAANAMTVEQVGQALQEQIGEWNRAGAGSLGAALKSKLPFYSDLSADFRRDLESASAQTDQPWTEEYADRLAKDLTRIIRDREEAAREAGRNEARGQAARTGTAPVAAPSVYQPGDDMSDDEVFARHMDHGFDVKAGGVTQEQLNQAKRNRNRE